MGVQDRRLRTSGWGGGGAAGPRPVLVGLPFRRSRPLRVVRFPRALRLAAFLRALPDRPPGPLLDRTRGERHATRADRRAPQARGEAGGRHPSASARTPGVPFPRASSLDHSPPPSRRWIRRPPRRRDGRYYEGGARGVAKIGVLDSQDVERAGCFSAKATIISVRRRCLLPVRRMGRWRGASSRRDGGVDRAAVVGSHAILLHPSTMLRMVPLPTAWGGDDASPLNSSRLPALSPRNTESAPWPPDPPGRDI